MKMTFITAAMAMCIGASLAQGGDMKKDNMGQMDHDHMGHHGMMMRMAGTDTEREAWFRISRTLTGPEQFCLEHELSELPGSFADVYYRAINKASSDNGGNLNADNNMMMNNNSMSSGDNMMGHSMYSMTFWDRQRGGITDGAAWDLLVKGVSPAERGVINQTWPNFTDSAQEAILHIIKRSNLISSMNERESRWYR